MQFYEVLYQAIHLHHMNGFIRFYLCASYCFVSAPKIRNEHRKHINVETKTEAYMVGEINFRKENLIETATINVAGDFYPCKTIANKPGSLQRAKKHRSYMTKFFTE